jgi:transposase InsO family protein
VIQLDARRLRRWASRWAMVRTPDTSASVREAPGASQRPVCGADRLSELTEVHLSDQRPVAKIAPHRLTDDERAEIVRAADDEVYAHLRHRKLTHQLSRDGRVFCSESSVLRVLRAQGKVPVYIRRHRPARPRPEVDESEPNRSWRYDITTFPTLAGDYHLVPVLDGCSRKIVGRHFGPEATSASVQTAWEKALANEGLLADEGPVLPMAVSDRGTQMTSKSTKTFFCELGIVQSFSRPRTPTDNASCESWMATLKCERLYDADTAMLTPDEVETMADRFIDYYNNDRLHQSLGFVTPDDRHTGRHTAIIEARRRGLELARKRRKQEAYGRAGGR